tara:strand:+ start:53 stop:283 length:231 start_codon:yes stop_codon:yes gene_type:complete
MKHQTQMTFPVELTFEILPAMSVDEGELPAQLDITKILLTITGPSGKPRQVNITKSFSEDQIMLFEDEIIESYQES